MSSDKAAASSIIWCRQSPFSHWSCCSHTGNEVRLTTTGVPMTAWEKRQKGSQRLGISWLSRSQNEQGIPDYRRDQGALVKIIGQGESKIQQSGVNQAVKWQAGLDAQHPWVQEEDWAAQWCQPQEASAKAWTQGVSWSLEDDIITDPTTVDWPPPSVPGPSDPLVPMEAMKPYDAHV